MNISKTIRRFLYWLFLLVSPYLSYAGNTNKMLDENITRLLVVPYHFALEHRNTRFGGIIYTGRDMKNLSQYGLDTILSLNNSFLNQEDPPFIMIDEEGGVVSRLRYFKEFQELCYQDESITDFLREYDIHVSYVLPSEREIGMAYEKVRDDQSDMFLRKFYKYNRSLARILRQLGFNTVLAPVVDVCDSGYMTDRTYSSDPKIVIELAGVMIQAFEEEGIFTCVKHFPGLGNLPNSQDPHYKKIFFYQTDENQLLPFYVLPSSMIMVSHGIYLDIDTLPLSVSPRTVDYLPDYRIVISDDISMSSVEPLWKDELFDNLIDVNDLIIITCFKSKHPSKQIYDFITRISYTDTSTVNKKLHELMKVKQRYPERFRPSRRINILRGSH